MRRFMIGAITAVTAFIATKKLTEKKDEAVVWISADAEGANTEVKPEFEVGELVVTNSPYTDDYVEFDYDGTPLHYKIEDVRWDEEDKCFRYLVNDELSWVAEPWLIRPKYPFMHKDSFEAETLEIDEHEGGEPERKDPIKGHRAAEKGELERRKAWSKQADELLDRYNGLVKAGDMDAAHAVMAQYKSEQAMFLAGNVIRELGGELNGERPGVSKSDEV